MNTSQKLQAILTAIQLDPGNRGLGRDPHENLFTACPEDLSLACASLAQGTTSLDVVTGFWIPSAGCGETDGPLGAIYLARTLPALGIGVVLVSDPFCRPALQAGLDYLGISTIPILDCPVSPSAPDWRGDLPPSTHTLALERVGRSHTPKSICAHEGDRETSLFLEEVPEVRHDRCHNMRGVDITASMRDASSLIEAAPGITIGIGDGGNEIGMGKIPWRVIRNNIPGGAILACRVPTRYLVVAGVSNWGAYALAAGVALEKGVTAPPEWFDRGLERAVLETMVHNGPLVDGVRGTRSVSVDGLDFDDYSYPLYCLERIARG